MNAHKYVNIRLLTISDVQLVATTFQFPWTTAQKSLEKWQRYAKEQEDASKITYIIDYNNKPIGYGRLLLASEYPHFRNSNIPEINDLWIAAESRKMGFGSLLINHFEQLAKQAGCKYIGLGVGLYKDYGPAQKLYAHLGYAPDGHGITYKYVPVNPGSSYPIDDELILWLVKPL